MNSSEAERIVYGPQGIDVPDAFGLQRFTVPQCRTYTAFWTA